MIRTDDLGAARPTRVAAAAQGRAFSGGIGGGDSACRAFSPMARCTARGSRAIRSLSTHSTAPPLIIWALISSQMVAKTPTKGVCGQAALASSRAARGSDLPGTCLPDLLSAGSGCTARRRRHAADSPSRQQPTPPPRDAGHGLPRTHGRPGARLSGGHARLPCRAMMWRPRRRAGRIKVADEDLRRPRAPRLCYHVVG